MKGVAIAIAAAVIVAVLAAGGFAAWWIHAPASPDPSEVIVDIPRGASSAQVSALLQTNGAIANARLFRLYLRLSREQHALRAGELRFRRNMTPHEALHELLKGEIVLHKVTVAEGLTSMDIATLFEDARIARADEFRKLVEDATFAHSLGVPADRLEGFLFPDTYEFTKEAGARVVITTMVKRFQQAWTADFADKAKTLGLGELEAVTLASIVEKESGNPTERPVIAGVFYNRLKKGMRLETDPTIIYGLMLRGTWDGNIRKKDLQDATNPYNTYVIKRLPPGPIANPGAESLHAVAYPAIHSYLYFVAEGSCGKSVFASTLVEQERNIQKWQLHRSGIVACP